MALEIGPDIMAHIAVYAAGIMTGIAVPTYYGMERMRGFGRTMMGKLPYTPPPGVEEGAALEAASNDDPDSDDTTK